MTTSIQQLLLQKMPSEIVHELDLGRTEFFDDVASTFVRLSGVDAALVILVGPEELHVVGAFGGEFSNFPRTIDRVRAKPIEVIVDLDAHYPDSHLVNGAQASAKSAIFCALELKNETIGSIVGITNERIGTSVENGDELVKLAEITSEVLREKIAFKLMLADVFALANA